MRKQYQMRVSTPWKLGGGDPHETDTDSAAEGEAKAGIDFNGIQLAVNEHAYICRTLFNSDIHPSGGSFSILPPLLWPCMEMSWNIFLITAH